MEEKFGYTVLAEKAFQIITYAGMSKSHAMEAIYAAKENNFEKAKKDRNDAKKTMIEAEKLHVDIVQHEAKEMKSNIVPLLHIHAENAFQIIPYAAMSKSHAMEAIYAA